MGSRLIPTLAIAAGFLGLGVGIGAEVGPPVSFVLVAVGAILAAVVIVGSFVLARPVRAAERAMRGQHPDALLEQVILWHLPSGPAGKLPPHVIVADPHEVTFRTYDDAVLARVAVADIDLLDTLTAQGDRSRDKATTLLFGDPQQLIQFFTATHLSPAKLTARVRKWTELGDRAR
ncbi:hypothetical protein BH11ACT3_BH11ACT3_06410 [soil metagenome]